MPHPLALAVAVTGVLLLACAGAIVAALRYQPPPPAAVVELAQAPTGWRHRLHEMLTAHRFLATAPIQRPRAEALSAVPRAAANRSGTPGSARSANRPGPYARTVFDANGRITLPDDHADAIITWHTTVATRDRATEDLLAPASPTPAVAADARIRLEPPTRTFSWSGSQD